MFKRLIVITIFWKMMCTLESIFAKGYGRAKNAGPLNLSTPNQKLNSIIDASNAARSITFDGSRKRHMFIQELFYV
ncbi:hypothetical protein NGH30_01320 [Macrococcus caseolyticus]|uniref:hypothetical protein n=1 Tax=Macrococcoides caseolyticum TaxID=69966 RepID=UPI002DB79157|nr:hypothetical protein [Macrococcus caseolyticus]MEB8170468.1 hypothetical protein [Macrococcus caseolyticus]